MTITTTAPALTATGITAPTYADILAFLQTGYKSIYGTDVYLGNDSQDGQFIAIVAKSISDANDTAVADYNARSPSTAQGNALSSLVKVNGITRAIPTNSTATITIVGVAGTAITNGVIQDANSNKWNLPASVNIPLAGTIDVTATCATAGAIVANAGTINKIITPQLGWQSATNALAAVLGAPVESDAALRRRQITSVAQPAQGPLDAIAGAVAKVAGVTRFAAYENPTGTTDANGVPAHSIAIVTEGGAAIDIANAIASKKTQGTGTYGTTAQVVLSAYGIPQTVNFFAVAPQRIMVSISIHAINGYTAAIGAKVQAAVAAYINALAIGSKVILTRLYAPATLSGSSDGLTYSVNALQICVYPGVPASSDIAIGFNQAAHCDAADVTLTLV